MENNTKWWNTWLGEKLTLIGLILGMMSVIVLPVAGLLYTQRYIQDTNKTTATRGIWLQKTVYLKEYKHLGDGNGIFGKYNRYSRSDRHEDVLTIYNSEEK